MAAPVDGRRRSTTVRLLAVLAGAFALAFAVSACGDDETSGSAGTTNAAAGAAKTLRFGTDPTYPPLEYKEGDKLTGAEVEIMEEVARLMNAKAQWFYGAFDSLLPSLKGKRFDIMAAGMYDRDVRRNELLFIDFLTNAGLGGLYRAADAPPDDEVSHLCGLTVAVQKGTGIADGPTPKLPRLTKDVCSEKVKSIVLPTQPAAQLAVQSGRADVFMTSYMNVANTAKTAGDGTQFKAVQYPGDDTAPIAVGVRPDETELADQLKGALQQVMDSGKYEEILAKYGIENMALDEITINQGQ